MYYLKKIILFYLIITTSVLFASSTIYEDAENGDTQGWSVYDSNPAGATFQNVFDTDLNNHAIQTRGAATSNGYKLGGFNAASGWNNTTQKIISWKMKFSESYVVYLRVKTKDWSGYIYYNSASNDYGVSSGYVHHGLGAESKNGSWQTFTRDLEADLQDFQPDNEILEVNGFFIRGSGRVDDIILKDSQEFTKSNLRDFKKINIMDKKYTNIHGDLLIIGNQSLCWKDTGSTCKSPPYDASDLLYTSKHANLDPKASDLGFLNSTSSYLELGEDDTVIEAWLFAFGRLFDKDKNLISSAQYIQLKTPTSNGYVKLKATNDKFNWDKGRYIFDYGITVNITPYVQKSGNYWVADLKTTADEKNIGAGWGIAVIVKDKTGQKRTLKNISLYSGFKGIRSFHNSVTSNISGFLTPRTGEVKSKLTFMTGLSTRGYTDTMSITKKDGSIVFLKDSLNNSHDLQNGTISKNGQNVTTRNPNYANTLGIDIDEIDVSTIIGNEQNSTNITIGTDRDRSDQYYLTMYGFSTELYTPKLCYDYSIHMGDHIKIPSKNNDINASYWQGEPLVLKIFIHNLESDFDLTDSHLKINFDKENTLQFKDNYATISPPGINAYLPAIPTGLGQISIGANNTDHGGFIGTNISLYAKMGYKILNPEALSNHFELEIKTKMQFSPDDSPVEYTFTSASNASSTNHIGLCSKDPVYNPVYERFNIEREESTFSQVPKVRYPLYTQMTGKDFSVSIASYGGANFEDPLTVNETTVELELIDAGNFDNNSSAGYDSVCEEPTSVAGSGTFIPFNNTNRVKVDLKTKLLGFNNDIALQNAAFRVWVLTKKDSNTSSEKRKTVQHLCTSITDETCFQKVYEDNYKNAEDTQFSLCANACGNNPTGCYSCLKKYFATPFCSRDNFSIRPESFRVSIADANESTDINAITSTTLSQNNSHADATLSLAAGYQYRLDINATCFNNNKISLGYYNNAFKAESNISNIAYINNKRVVAPLLFNDLDTCTDNTHSTLGIKLQNGRIIGDKSISHDNVGAYTFSIRDSNWTNVDQASYPYKTIFDPSCQNSDSPECSDCVVGSSASILPNNKIGCNIDSELKDNEKHISLPLVFHPYAFGVNTAQKNRPNQNILFMNNLFDDYYGSVLSDHLSMASSFEGNITALNKKNNVVSNFTKSCVASDVNLHLARTMNPSEDMLIAMDAPLQQYLEIDVDKKASAEGNSTSLTLDKDSFKDKNKGQVTIQLHTTLKKPLGYEHKMNPVQVRYNSLKVSSVAEKSHTHTKVDYIPEGERDYDSNITYVYGKITPENRLYTHIEEDGKRTPIYVDIFCDLSGTLCTDNFGLDTDSLGKEEIESGWKLATIFDNAMLGTTDIEIQYLAEKNADPVISVDTLEATKLAKDVAFNDNKATQNDINISVKNGQRNSMIKVTFKPVPWLKYNPEEDYYRLHFVGSSAWAGVGKTGYVTDTQSSDTQNNRMNW